MIMESTHIRCQHNNASAPLPGWAPGAMLAGVDYELFLKRLGAEIRRRRKARKMNQIAFADLVQTDQGSISRLENGKQGFDSPLLYRISQAFDTMPGELCAAAVHSPLAENIPPDAVRVAEAWHKLGPDTTQSILHTVELALQVAATAPTSAPPRQPRKTARAKH